MLDKMIEQLKKAHGKNLTFKSGEAYYLFYKNGLLTIYLDSDTKTLKVNVELLEENNIFVYFSDEMIDF